MQEGRDKEKNVSPPVQAHKGNNTKHRAQGDTAGEPDGIGPRIADDKSIHS